MKGIQNGLRMNTGVRQILTVIVSVSLCWSVLVQDSGAANGFCDNTWTCCSGDTECTEGGTCILKKGECWTSYEYCDLASECENPFSFYPNACLPVGECMAGEHDGDPCLVANGICLNGPFFSFPCNNALDCGQLGPCVPAPLFDSCPGGTCVPCVQGCSIATATLGTELQDKIDVLQSFRDKYLLKNAIGKSFVAAYYKYSPPIADYIAERGWLRRLVRIMLLPVIGIVSFFV